MFDLRDVLQLVVDRLYDRSFVKHILFMRQHQLVFHVPFDLGHELEVLLQKLFEELLTDVASVPEK